MKVFINNQELLEHDNTGIILEEITKFVGEQGLIVTEILVNGIVVNLELKDALTLEGAERYDITAFTAPQLVSNSISEALNYIPSLTRALGEASDLFQQGEEGKAIKLFLETMDGIEWVNDLANLLENSDIIDDRMEEISTSGLAGELKEKLDQLLDAWQNRDYILIGDILNYELIPSLEKFVGLLENAGREVSES